MNHRTVLILVLALGIGASTAVGLNTLYHPTLTGFRFDLALLVCFLGHAILATWSVLYFAWR
jgi:hypothetical protein